MCGDQGIGQNGLQKEFLMENEKSGEGRREQETYAPCSGLVFLSTPVKKRTDSDKNIEIDYTPKDTSLITLRKRKPLKLVNVEPRQLCYEDTIKATLNTADENNENDNNSPKCTKAILKKEVHLHEQDAERGAHVVTLIEPIDSDCSFEGIDEISVTIENIDLSVIRSINKATGSETDDSPIVARKERKHVIISSESSGSEYEEECQDLQELTGAISAIRIHDHETLNRATKKDHIDEFFSNDDIHHIVSSEDDMNTGILIYDGPTKPKKLTDVWIPDPPSTPTRKALPTLFRPMQTPFNTKFKKEREVLSRQLFQEFNTRAFDNKLPQDMDISWSVNLHKTAGRTFLTKTIAKTLVGKDFIYSARIELSTKVLDTLEKLRNTLIHEMCHAASWLVEHNNSPPHGPVFKNWGNKCMKAYPELIVTTCHSYEISFKHWYVCTNEMCQKKYGRHSKSIDTERKGCGSCSSRLVLLEKLKKDGTPIKSNPYTQYIKEHRSRFVEAHPNMDWKSIQKLITAEYNEKKISSTKKAFISDFKILDAGYNGKDYLFN